MRTVAIVGRPNVGKSRLFNRLVGKRMSIVHDQPGITRDVVSTFVEDGAFTLQDTGGIGLTGGESTPELTAASERQVDFALETANLVLFIIDGIDGITALDTRIAQRLRRAKQPVQLVVNKADFGDTKVDMAEVYRLGLGEPVMFSAEHGRGHAELRDAIFAAIGPAPVETDQEIAAARAADEALCVCFVGRPNVGKSSLSNRLLDSDRLIVSATPGTTRDAVELPFQFKGRNGKLYPFRLIDTAGIKAQTKLASPVEYFSRLRSLDAIQRADVVFMVLDAVDGVTQQDKAIAGEAAKERKPVIIVVNKWDLVKKTFTAGGDQDFAADAGLHGYSTEREYREKYEHSILSRLFFTPGSPVIFVSAMSGYEISRMLNAAVKLSRVLDTKVPTARLNRILGELAERTPPPSVGGKRFKIFYATQTRNRPFRFKIFCNREEKLTEQYRRYLEAGLVKEFGLDGCPMYFDLVGKDSYDHTRPAGGKAVQDSRSRRSRNAKFPGPTKQGDNELDHETLED
jgi:GTPase